MGRNNTRAAKSIAKMYEQLGLPQDDIFHKTKLLLSIYRDVVWATLSDCRCVNAEINYYGDDLNDALIYLEEFAPDIERSEFEHRVCNLFENKWIASTLQYCYPNISYQDIQYLLSDKVNHTGEDNHLDTLLILHSVHLSRRFVRCDNESHLRWNTPDAIFRPCYHTNRPKKLDYYCNTQTYWSQQIPARYWHSYPH